MQKSLAPLRRLRSPTGVALIKGNTGRSTATLRPLSVPPDLTQRGWCHAAHGSSSVLRGTGNECRAGAQDTNNL